MEFLREIESKINDLKVIDYKEETIDDMEKRFRENNIRRLSTKVCFANAGVLFFDLLSNLERIGDHSNNIATVKESLEHKVHI